MNGKYGTTVRDEHPNYRCLQIPLPRKANANGTEAHHEDGYRQGSTLQSYPLLPTGAGSVEGAAGPLEEPGQSASDGQRVLARPPTARVLARAGRFRKCESIVSYADVGTGVFDGTESAVRWSSTI